jgi:hypothetical protein
VKRSVPALLAALAMCLATTVVDGIPDERRPVYEYTSAEVSAAADADLDAALAPFRLAGRLNQSTPQFYRVQQIFSRVLDVARQRSDLARQLDWAAYVPEGPLLEAYSRAGGKIVLSAKFLERYRPNDAELAFIIGHEIAHVLCEHERMNLSAVWRRNAPQRLPARYAMEFLDTEPVLRAQLAPTARLQERIADRLGLELAMAAGIDRMGALGFFDKSADEVEGGGIFQDMHDTPLERKSVLLPTAAQISSLSTLFDGREPGCAP